MSLLLLLLLVLHTHFADSCAQLALIFRTIYSLLELLWVMIMLVHLLLLFRTVSSDNVKKKQQIQLQDSNWAIKNNIVVNNDNGNNNDDDVYSFNSFHLIWFVGCVHRYTSIPTHAHTCTSTRRIFSLFVLFTLYLTPFYSFDSWILFLFFSYSCFTHSHILQIFSPLGIFCSMKNEHTRSTK